jgi:hypothetical protein
MKKIILYTLPIIIFSTIACDSRIKKSGYRPDTIAKSSMDTTGQQVLPGTPGPNGTEPKSKDSTSVKDSNKTSSPTD